MARGAIARKWRPPLALVVFAVLLGTLALPVAIVVAFRALENTASRMGPVEIGALAVALCLTLVLALVLSRTITGPIEALVARAREIGHGGRAAILPIDRHGTREIAELSHSILDLAERLVDRSDHLRSFASHVSHELKSPLTAIKGAAELLREGEDGQAPMQPADRRRFLDGIVAETERLAALLDRLRELARAEEVGLWGTSSLEAVLPGLAGRFPGLALEVGAGGDTPLPLPGETLAIVLSHLADNARAHGARTLDLAVRSEGDALLLSVRDDGEGISPGNRALIFQPFFTTRRESGGTGMGLEIVRTMLAARGGTIALVPSAAGAAFEIGLPRG